MRKVVVKAMKVGKVKQIQNPKINKLHLIRHSEEVRGKTLTITKEVLMENKKRKRQNDDNEFIIL